MSERFSDEVSYPIRLFVFWPEAAALMKLRQIGTVGRATVPAGIGRHGGRPYARMIQFLFIDQTGPFLARGRALMKLQGMTNDE